MITAAVDRRQAHGGADEVLEFAGVDLAQSLEPRDLGLLAAAPRDGGDPLLVAVAVDRLLLVPHPEERRLQDVEVPLADDPVEEAHEDGDHQVADVQAVDIGIGGEDDLLVAEVVDRLLDVEALHQVVDLDILVDRVPLEVADVERLAAQGEDGLGVDVAAAGDRAGRGEALGDEDHRVEPRAALHVEVVLAVLELRHAHRDGPRALARELLDLVQLGAQLAGLVDLADEPGGLLGLAVQHLDDHALDLGDQVGADLGVAEPVLGLRFEDRILEADGDGPDDPLADIVAVELLLAEVVDGLQQALLEGRQVRAAVVRELAVDERVVLLAEAVGVREDEFEGLGPVVERGVELLELGLVADQVEQPLLRDELLAVDLQRQAGVEVGVHPHAAGDVLFAELELLEDLRVGREAHEGAVALRRPALAPLLRDERALVEEGLGELALAEGAHLEGRRQGVDGLGADAVHADRELEDIVVELAAGVLPRDAVDDAAEGDAAAVVADGDLPGRVVDGDLDLAAVAHDELVDGIIDDLLQEDVDAVLVLAAIARAADVHAGALADVVDIRQGLDMLFVVGLLHRRSLVWRVSRPATPRAAARTAPGRTPD